MLNGPSDTPNPAPCARCTHAQSAFCPRLCSEAGVSVVRFLPGEVVPLCLTEFGTVLTTSEWYRKFRCVNEDGPQWDTYQEQAAIKPGRPRQPKGNPTQRIAAATKRNSEQRQRSNA
eukprot:3564171-Rhodomonas_salina.1